MGKYAELCNELTTRPQSWLVTGVAGFIGSHLLETLLRLGQRVIGLDNFATGFQRNLDQVRAGLSAEQWAGFTFLEGDIRRVEDCHKALALLRETGAAQCHVLHQAALGSVPRSLENPAMTNSVNIDGFVNMLVASRDAAVTSFTYAASSSTYGDHPALPKREDAIGKPLSPYAVTKLVNELYAEVFARSYGFQCIGLRYFNVFGRRQDPDGAYAAVIPKWAAALLRSETVFMNGDGETSRDFCHVSNAVQANLLAATAMPESKNQVYNVAVGDRTTLNTLFELLRDNLASCGVNGSVQPSYRDFRAGDVRHSQADISKAAQLLGYAPEFTIRDGIKEAMPWYVANATAAKR